MTWPRDRSTPCNNDSVASSRVELDDLRRVHPDGDTGRQAEAAAVLQTFAGSVQDGLLPNLFPEGDSAGLYHTADATLWFFHVKGIRFGIGLDERDGLLRQGAPGYQLTWMDVKVGDWVVTPRRGKAVEINARALPCALAGGARRRGRAPAHAGWAWLIGPFVDAWLRVHPEDRAGARRFLDGLVAYLGAACVGSISEIFDAAPPSPRGAAWRGRGASRRRSGRGSKHSRKRPIAGERSAQKGQSGGLPIRRRRRPRDVLRLASHLRNGLAVGLHPRTGVADRLARSGLILAGGQGGRLSELTRRICGDDRPVQFCPLFGGATPLEQTRQRAARLIPAGHTVVAVVKPHEQFYNRLLADLPPEHVIAQPEDRGTTPAILYGLLRLAAIGAGGPVAVLPSDHYVSDDGRFMAYVDAAFRAVAARPDLVVLLGMKAESLELEYGWIEPGEPIPGRWTETFYRVRRFWEKPRPALGEELLARGCLWNSFVMVAQPIVLATLIRRELPSLVERFLALRTRLAELGDSDRVRQLYARLAPADFSRQVLATRPPNLAVLPVTGVDWSNLNHPERASLALARAGIDLPSTPAALSA